jgi:hypothetical protein
MRVMSRISGPLRVQIWLNKLGIARLHDGVGRLQIGAGSGVHVQFKPTGSKGNGIREGDFD